jgi:hypothetical protein
VPQALTDTTIRYLFATTWLPTDPAERQVRVPGGSTIGVDTGGNLLHAALWNLRAQGLMEFEQRRPVEHERVRVMGGRPFSGFRVLRATGSPAPGLEGALLAAARADEGDVRELVRALDLDDRSPWGTVCSHCFREAHSAGLVAVRGRVFKKIVITDPAAVEAMRERHDELRAARGKYLDAEPELTGAVIADCLRVVADAFGAS